MPRMHPRGGHDYGVRHLHALRDESIDKIVNDLLFGDTSLDQVTMSAHELIQIGGVYVESQRVSNPDALIPAGSLVRVHTQPRRYPALPDLASRIVQQTPDYLVVDKPAGLPVHAMVDNSKENLLRYLEAHLGRPVYITHRLDIETSGLLLVALTPAAQSSLNKQLAAKKIKRRYVAFTQAEVRPQKYEHFMEDTPRAPKIMHDIENEHYLNCDLTVLSCEATSSEELAAHWRIESLSPSRLFRLAIELGTGRTQQIRAQLSHLGAPIIGDRIYKNESCLLDRITMRQAIALRADRLQLPPN